MTPQFFIKCAFGVKGYKLISQTVEGDCCYVEIEAKCGDHRCPECGRRCPAYDTRPGFRAWRHLDYGRLKCFIRMRVRRVSCPEHGVRVEAVSFADPGSRYTHDFESAVAYKALRQPYSSAARELRVNWHAVESIVPRVFRRLEPNPAGRLDGIVSLGIDETKVFGEYYMVFYDNARAQIAAILKGRSSDTIRRFLMGMMTKAQRARIKVVTADGAAFIRTTVRECLPKRVAFCLDAFHAVKWANEALDSVRKGRFRVGDYVSADMEFPDAQSRDKAITKATKGAKFALLRGKGSRTAADGAKIAEVTKRYPAIGLAFQAKEMLADIFRGAFKVTGAAVNRFVRFCKDSGIAELKKLAKQIAARKGEIVAAVKHRASNAGTEGVNSKIQEAITRSRGYRNVENAIRYLMFYCSHWRKDIKLPFET